MDNNVKNIEVPDGTIFTFTVTVEIYNNICAGVTSLPYKDAIVIFDMLSKQVKEQITPN